MYSNVELWDVLVSFANTSTVLWCITWNCHIQTSEGIAQQKLGSGSVKDMPYKLLKGYNITPLHSGMIAIHKYLNMTAYASLSQELFYIEAPQLEWSFPVKTILQEHEA